MLEKLILAYTLRDISTNEKVECDVQTTTRTVESTLECLESSSDFVEVFFNTSWYISRKVETRGPWALTLC